MRPARARSAACSAGPPNRPRGPPAPPRARSIGYSRASFARLGRRDVGRAPAPEPLAPEPEPIEVEIDHRGGIERQDLAHQQAPDDGNAERTAELAALAETEGKRHGAKERRHGGHHDRAEA